VSSVRAEGGAVKDFHPGGGRDAATEGEPPVTERPFAGGRQRCGIIGGHIVLLEKKAVIRREQHVAPVDVRHLLDDQVQLLKGLFHGIECFALRAGRIAGLINDVVENVDDLVVAHERAAIGFGVQLEEILGLNCGALTAAGET
jgi:hypothetical protein